MLFLLFLICCGYFSVLGNEVIGVWLWNVDKVDVNCVNFLFSGFLFVIGDDFGFVKLFEFLVMEKFVSLFLIFVYCNMYVEIFKM